MQFSAVNDIILEKLKKDLPGHLSYHDLSHTQDVYSACERIAATEGVKGDDLILLLTAALFHDSGFLIKPEDHELISCNIARDILPKFGYSSEKIERICGMIMATKIPQNPLNHMEELICDADLDYLGRDDFFTISDKLFKEFLFLGRIKNEDDWNKLQVGFFESHHYFTETSKRERDKKKQENLAVIKSKIDKAI